MTADATQMLERLENGDQLAAETLLPLIEGELRAIARRHLSQESPGHTYQTTMLVDEAYVRLINQQDVNWQSRAHFFALAAMSIRRILVDHARKRNAVKRGGEWLRIDSEQIDNIADASGVDLIVLDDLLDRLATLDERQARVVELRFFAGLTVDDTAEVLNVSPRTVEFDWQMARAWLRRELTDADADADAEAETP